MHAAMNLRSTLSLQYQRLHRSWRFYVDESGLPSQVPRGHYYSPLPEPGVGVRHAAAMFRLNPAGGLPGINLQIEKQRELLLKMSELYSEFDWNEQSCLERR